MNNFPHPPLHPLQGGTPEPIVAFAVSPDGSRLLTFGRGLLCRLWAVASGECVRSWKAHRLPVQVAAFDASGTVVASGGSDRSVMVWDTDGGYATHNFRGGHEGLVTAVAFQPHPVSVQTLVSGGDDGRVCVWDLTQTALVAVLSEHVAPVTALLFSPDAGGHVLVTGGRDRVLNVWDLRDAAAAAEGGGGGAARKKRASSGASSAALKCTVPVFEGIEGAVMLPLSEGGSGRELRFVTDRKSVV